MKDADDRHLGFRFAIEYDVLLDRMGAQTPVDIVAPDADTRRIPKRPEAVPDLAQVLAILRGAPLGSRILAYPLEIAPGGTG